MAKKVLSQRQFFPLRSLFVLSSLPLSSCCCSDQYEWMSAGWQVILSFFFCLFVVFFVVVVGFFLPNAQKITDYLLED